MWEKIKSWFRSLFGIEAKEVVKEQAQPVPPVVVPPETPEAPAAPPPITPEAPVIDDRMVAPKVLRQWPVKLESFGAPLLVRPPEVIPGWEHVHTRIGLDKHVIVRWRDPGSGLVCWVDKQPQVMPHQDWYHITSSSMVDMLAPVWNFLWSNRQTIDSRNTEEGLQRLRDYQGGLRSNPEMWPEPYRSVYLESH